MEYKLLLHSVSDEDLLGRLSELLSDSRRIEAELVAHMGEVDARKLFRRTSSSMFTYATEILNLSEAEAYLRIGVARASRKHPVLLEMLGDGRLHLSGIAVLAPHLTPENRDDLLARASNKSKKEIEELIAAVSPKPDAPETIRKLPERRKKAQATPSTPAELRLDRVDEPSSDASQSRPDVKAGWEPEPARASAPAKPAVVEPLAPAKYRVQFTASGQMRDKLERLRALMGSPDLATVLEVAVSEKLERLESKRFGKTKAPRSNLELRCPAHNAYQSELDYGKEWIERRRRSPTRVSEPTTMYIAGSRAPAEPARPQPSNSVQKELMAETDHLSTAYRLLQKAGENLVLMPAGHHLSIHQAGRG